MNVLVNGEEYELPEGLNVARLLERLELDEKPVLVEHNGQALHKVEHEQAEIYEGAKLEIVLLAAGG